MPAHKKPPEARQDRRASRMLAVVTAETRLPVPEPPDGLLPEILVAWRDYWSSRIATAVDRDSDMPGLIRWIRAYDEWLRATRALRKVRIVAGSMGQPVLSPLAGYVAQRAAELKDLESAYGMTPKARLNLGLAAGEIALTAARLNEMADDDSNADSIDADLEVLEGAYRQA